MGWLQGRKLEYMMSYRLFAGVFLALGLLCGGVSLVVGQAVGEKKEEKKEEKKDDSGDKKDEAKEEKPLTNKEYLDLMESEVKDSWNKLKINHRNKRGEQAATAADNLAKAFPKLMRYDGEVLKGDNKGKKAREQKDFKGWADDLKTNAEEYAKHVRKGDWDKAEKSKDKINETCGACHDVYEPKG
jgi:hypothetical protein